MQRFVSRHLTALAMLAALGLLVAAGSAVAQKTSYRWVDAQGVVHYSDTPQPGAQVIQLPSAQTYRAPPAQTAVSKAAAAAAAAAPNAPDSPYQSCGIVEPAAEAYFFAPETVPVTVSLAPGLRPGDQVAVTVDGSPLAPMAADSLQYQVPAPDRGAHTVNVIVREPDGKQVCRAAPITFYVQRPSALSPASPVRRH
jgi:Domain of unknown function (DUF4124)